jgi:hypothetical protein
MSKLAWRKEEKETCVLPAKAYGGAVYPPQGMAEGFVPPLALAGDR